MKVGCSRSLKDRRFTFGPAHTFRRMEIVSSTFSTMLAARSALLFVAQLDSLVLIGQQTLSQQYSFLARPGASYCDASTRPTLTIINYVAISMPSLKG